MLAILVSGLTSAQDISVQGGSFLNKEISGIHAADGNGDQAFIGYIEGSLNFLKSEKFKIGPVAKLYAYNKGFFYGGPDNDYAVTAGLDVGLNLSKNVEFNVGYELPVPHGFRSDVFQSVISPSLIFGDGEGLGFKINYDYFFQKKLFEYQSAFTAGLIYQF